MRTVALIIQATAQLLQREGAHRLSTNRIAAVAGVSVGTIYQYFSSKDGVLVTLASRERDEMLAALDAVFERASVRPPEETVREAVRTMIRIFAHRHEIRREMMRFVIAQRLAPQVMRITAEVADGFAQRLSRLTAPGLRPLDEAARFVISRAVMGVLRSTVMEDSRLVAAPALEDEMTRLVMATIKA